jgi:hypothetical protein
MPLTSSPSTLLYQLGKGILSIGLWSGATPPASYTDVGNCPRLEVEVTEERLAHFSSRSGTRVKDKEVVLETGYNVNFDLDEFSLANLAMFLKGTISGNVILANTVLDQEYALRFDSDNPAGPNERWEFHRCTLAPGGTLSLIGDEWAKMSFAAAGLADVANHSTSPYFTVELMTTTSTTTTTTP